MSIDSLVIAPFSRAVLSFLIFLIPQLCCQAQQWIITKVENKISHEEESSPLLGAYFTLSKDKARIATASMTCSEFSSKIDDRIIYFDNSPKFSIEYRTRTTMILTEYNEYPNNKKIEKSLSRYYLEDLQSFLQKTYQSGELKTEPGNIVLLDNFFHASVIPGKIDTAVTQRMPPIIKHGSASGYILFQKDSSVKVNILRTNGKFNDTDAMNLHRAMVAVTDRFNLKHLPGATHKLLFYVQTEGYFSHSLKFQWHTLRDMERIPSRYVAARKEQLKELYLKNDFATVIKESTELLQVDSSDQYIYYLRAISLMMAGKIGPGCSELSSLAKNGHSDAAQNFSKYCNGYPSRKISVMGRVVDMDTKKPVNQAKIHNELFTREVETNSLGYFQFLIDSGSQIMITHQDFDSVSLVVGQAKNFQIPMKKIPVMETKDVVFDQVDRPAFIHGGEQALASFLSDRMEAPGNLTEYGYRGRVDLNLLIAENGNIDSIVVVKTTHELHTLEAFRLMHLLRRIEPALKNGVRVRSWATLSIGFPVYGGGLVRERNIKDEALAEDYFRMGVEYADINYSEALAILHRALTLDPVLARALYFRGAIYYETGQHSAAIEDWKQASRLDFKGNSFVRNAIRD